MVIWYTYYYSDSYVTEEEIEQVGRSYLPSWYHIDPSSSFIEFHHILTK